MTCFVVIADDLTGAMDAGVQMLKKDYVVRVTLDVNKISEWQNESDVIIVSTESRNIPEVQAYECIAETLKEFKKENCRIIYKKIDSTLRGNVGIELKAVLEHGDVDGVIMAPALPFNGRTTVNGVHYVYGSPLEHTELAKDPYAPVFESEISKIIHEQYGIEVGIIDIRAIRNGRESVISEIEKNLNGGKRLMVADAIDDGDLRNIVKACGGYSKRILLCGSAGLFTYIDKMGQLNREPGHRRMRLPRRKKSSPILVLSGSPANMSKLQIEKLEKECKRAFILRCNISEYLNDEEKFQAVCKESICQVIEKLQNGYHVVVDASGYSKENILNQYQDNRSDLLMAGKKILNYLEEISAVAVTNVNLRGLVLFGGDTAVAVIKRLGAYGVEITGEIEPYIPLGIMIGGMHERVPVVTKSGGFGREDSLVSIIKKLVQ